MTDTQLATWARNLTGTVDANGYLVLHAQSPLTVANRFEGGFGASAKGNAVELANHLYCGQPESDTAVHRRFRNGDGKHSVWVRRRSARGRERRDRLRRPCRSAADGDRGDPAGRPDPDLPEHHHLDDDHTRVDLGRRNVGVVGVAESWLGTRTEWFGGRDNRRRRDLDGDRPARGTTTPIPRSDSRTRYVASHTTPATSPRPQTAGRTGPCCTHRSRRCSISRSLAASPTRLRSRRSTARRNSTSSSGRHRSTLSHGRSTRSSSPSTPAENRRSNSCSRETRAGCWT